MALTKEQLVQPKTVIHCETEEEANRLLAWAQSVGLKWSSGSSYKTCSFYSVHLEATCYDLYRGKCGSFDNYIDHQYTIIPFAALGA